MLVAPFPPTSPNKIYITGTGTGYISAACETPNRRRRRPRHDKFSMNRWADRPCDAYRLVYPDDRLKPICARVCVCVCVGHTPQSTFPMSCHRTKGRQTAGDLGSNAVLTVYLTYLDTYQASVGPSLLLL